MKIISLPINRFQAFLLGILSLLLAGSAPAATLTWDADTGTTGAQDGSGSWTNANSWWNGAANVTWSPANVALFGAGVDGGTYYINVAGLPNPAVSNILFQTSGYVLTNATSQSVALSAGSGITAPQIHVDFGKTATLGTNVILEPSSTVTGGLYIGATTPGTAGTLNIENGATVRNTISAANSGSITLDGIGTVLNVNAGGTLAQTGAGNFALVVANPANSSCTLNVQGGTVSSVGVGSISGMIVGNAGTGVVSMTSGTISMAATANALNLGRSAGSDGTFNLDGGILSASLVKKGLGNSGVFNFNGGTLKALAATASFMTNLTRANVRNGGAIIDSGGFAITIGQRLEHSSIGGDALTDGGLIKTNTGTLTLYGANTYNGPTVIKGGTLSLSSPGSLAGSATVQNNAFLTGNGSVSGAVAVNNGGSLTAGLSGVGNLALGSLTLGAAGGDTQTVNLTLNNALLSVSGALTANGTTTINVSSSGFVSPGTYSLITYSGPQVTSGLVLGIKPAGSALSYGASSIDLVVTDSLLWTGANSAVWDITTTNWQWITAATATKYVNGYVVLFDDTAANTGLTLNTAVSPGSVVFNNNSATYSLAGSGSIGGTGSLSKTGNASLTIANANTYVGGTTLSAGNLEANNNSALGSGLLTLSGGTLSNSTSSTLNNAVNLTGSTSVGVPAANTLTLSGVITNTGALTKVGNGTLILSGANSYSGITTNAAGTLTLTGSRTGASGAITVGVDTNLATLNIQAGSFPMGTNGINVGTGSVGITNGIVNQTGGDIAFTSGLALLVGGAATPTNSGVYNLSGGSITGFASANRGLILGVNADSKGVFNLSGTGSLNLSAGILQIGRSEGTSTPNNTAGSFYQTGGTATIGTLAMGSKAGGTGGNAILRLIGGTFTNSTFSRLCLGADTAAITIGGTADVTLGAFPTTHDAGATETLTLDGGTLRPYTNSASYMGGLTHAYVTANGANFNVASGSDITVSQLLEDAPSQVGVLTKAGAGVLTLQGTNTYTGGTTISEGALKIGFTGSINNTAGITNNAALIFNQTSIPLTVSNVISGLGTVTKTGADVLTLAGANTYSGSTTISNGTMALIGAGSIASSPLIFVNSGATLDVSAVTGVFTLAGAQTLSGTGTVVGPATINGTLGAGASPGTLTISNNLILNGKTVAEVSLDGTGTNDQWIVSGAVTFGGTLVVTNIGLAPLTSGAVFHLFTVAGAANGNFTSVIVTPDALAGTFDPATGNVTLITATLPTPRVNQVRVSGGNLILQGTNGAAGGTFSILESTNVALPLSTWKTNQTGTFSGSGTFSNAIPLGSEPKRFFDIKQP